MIRRLPAAIITAVFLCAFLAQAAPAQQKVKLQFKAKKGQRFKYDLNLGGSLDMDLKELPFPKSQVNVKDLMGSVLVNMYFETTDAADGVYTFDVKALMDKAVLGGLLQFDGLGFRSTTISPKISLSMDSSAKIKAVDFADLELPGGAAPKGLPGLDSLGLGAGQMNDMISMILGMFPPLLPEQEVGVGDTWSKEINFDEMGMGAFLPRIPFNFKLSSIQDGVAIIDYTTKGTFDGKVLNSFLALIPEVPMGDDILKISNINLIVNWDGGGVIKFSPAAGRFEEATFKAVYDTVIGANTSFKHPDESKEDWNSDGKIKMTIDMTLKYGGEPTADEVNEAFPPAEEQAAGTSKL